VKLILHRQPFSIIRLPAGIDAGKWLKPGSPMSGVLWDRDGWTVVGPAAHFECEPFAAGKEACDPDGDRIWWRCFEVDETFGFDAIGIVHGLSQALAEARIPVLVFSSWSTDYLLIDERHEQRASIAFRLAGHEVAEADEPSG
jgi:hypothetical protein